MFANKSKITKGPESIGGLKKKAPPRPPPPSNTQITRSITIHGVSSIGSTRTAQNHQKQVQRNQSTCSYNITNRADLIDLSSPTNSPPKSDIGIMSALDTIAVPDFKYHIGASIFYVKSELKNTGNSPQANPFSPPRPSPQSLFSTGSKASASKSKAPVPTKFMSNPTIIKPNAQRADSSGNNNVISQTNSQLQSKTASSQYTNVPIEWDEPPKKSYAPTVIRPIPPPKKPGLAASSKLRNNISGFKDSKNVAVDNSPPPMVPYTSTVDHNQQLYYDEPPAAGGSDYDDDEFDSKPMPSMPPPPPPADLESSGSGEVIGSQANASSYDFSTKTSAVEWSDGNRPYGIALYDYVSGEAGDLQFLAGDVIYLKYRIDESWLNGSCGVEEGIFPSNFINIVVPLPDDYVGDETTQITGYEPDSSSSRPASYSNSTENYGDTWNSESTTGHHYVQVLHDFQASELNDLTIHEGDVVTVLGKINDDWLYGELYGNRGQFPASFLSYVPEDLAIIDLNSSSG